MDTSTDAPGDIEDLIKCYRKQNLSNESVESISFKRSQLLRWYKENRRLLPWRGDNTHISPSPYGTWISEIMLQQTRVETVIEYWKRWMEAFPSLESLSAASPDDVNKLWAGLGYYRRAQQLLKGAQFVMKEFGGIIPSTVEDLLKIPGIGPYTAGAIASIAFGKAAPLVDGNVIRVFSRLYGITAEIGGAGGVMEKSCWSLAGQLVDPVDPGAFNQALMELGATVCKPTSPLCDSCPVRGVCTAKALVDHKQSQPTNASLEDLPSEVTFFPRKVAKKKPLEVTLSVCVLVSCPVEGGNAKYLFCRRPAKGLLANQWEFPSVVLAENDPNNSSSSSATEDDAEEEEVVDANQKVYSESELWTPIEEYLKAKFNINVSQDSESADSSQLMEVPTSVDYSRLRIEPIVHIFSHQRHTMHISVKHVNNDAALSSSSEERGRWMSAEEITSEGITSGCKKILHEVIKCSSVPEVKATKKRKSSAKEESEVEVVEVIEEPKKVFANVFEKMLNASSSSSGGGKSSASKKKNKSV